MLAAACLALNQVGEGSSPSDPTFEMFVPDEHGSSSGQDTAPVMRRREFESHPVLLFFDNSIRFQRTHDVAAACCLARADVRVRLPLGAFYGGGTP